MLDTIISLVKDQSFEAIKNNADIPANKKSEVAEATASSIVDSLQNQISSGDISSITNLFGGGSKENSLTDTLQSTVVSTLGQKLGLSPTVASSIASAVIPAIMNAINNKSKDPNDSFNLESMAKSVLGDQGGSILGSLKGLFGK